MIDKELSELKNDIPNIDIKDFKSGVYKKYDIRQSRHKTFYFKPLITCVSLIIIVALIVVLIPTSKPSNEQIGGFYNKNKNISLEESLTTIMDKIDFVYSNKSSTIDEFKSIGIISDDEYERIKKLEENTTLNKGYELLENIDTDFKYACYMGKNKGKDIIILVDNNSNNDVVIYHYVDYKLNYSVDKLIEIYDKYNDNNNNIINFTSTINNVGDNNISTEIKYCFGDNSSNKIINVIANNNKIESIYVNASSSNIEYINLYCDGYNEDSLCYIDDLKFEGAEHKPPKVYCCGFNTITSLSSRIEGIKNQNKTIYEVKKSVEGSPLLAAYVNKETYDLITKVYENTRLIMGGKYPTAIAVYESLIEKGYIEDNITWYEMEYDTWIPKTLDNMYYLDVFMYQEITVIKDVIFNNDINFTFKILIEATGVNISSNGVRVKLSNESFHTNLIYGEKMLLDDFNGVNIEMIIKNVTGNKEIEEITYINEEKLVCFYSSNIAPFNQYTKFEVVYEGFIEDIERILYKKEEVMLNGREPAKPFEPSGIILEDGTVITFTPSYIEAPIDILVGYNYFFKYDDYIEYLKNTLN